MAEVRKSRPRPHLDTKMLASWNGLMLSAYARVGSVLGDKDLLERAEQAGNFLKEHLWDPERQTMLRSCYRGDQMEVEQINQTGELTKQAELTLVIHCSSPGHFSSPSLLIQVSSFCYPIAAP
ncbi:hypothetical protein WMY93_009845 [Mugilogobius chulae]|uniref:Uncharacterized protein n=1 Tax=Mugilogobius chulae TaxID=88201 RepID=A0AAW0P909_9GOBI